MLLTDVFAAIEGIPTRRAEKEYLRRRAVEVSLTGVICEPLPTPECKDSKVAAPGVSLEPPGLGALAATIMTEAEEFRLSIGSAMKKKANTLHSAINILRRGLPSVNAFDPKLVRDLNQLSNTASGLHHLDAFWIDQLKQRVEVALDKCERRGEDPCDMFEKDNSDVPSVFDRVTGGCSDTCDTSSIAGLDHWCADSHLGSDLVSVAADNVGGSEEVAGEGRGVEVPLRDELVLKGLWTVTSDNRVGVLSEPDVKTASVGDVVADMGVVASVVASVDPRRSQQIADLWAQLEVLDALCAPRGACLLPVSHSDIAATNMPKQ